MTKYVICTSPESHIEVGRAYKVYEESEETYTVVDKFWHLCTFSKESFRVVTAEEAARNNIDFKSNFALYKGKNMYRLSSKRVYQIYDEIFNDYVILDNYNNLRRIPKSSFILITNEEAIIRAHNHPDQSVLRYISPSLAFPIRMLFIVHNSGSTVKKCVIFRSAAKWIRNEMFQEIKPTGEKMHSEDIGKKVVCVDDMDSATLFHGREYEIIDSDYSCYRVKSCESGTLPNWVAKYRFQFVDEEREFTDNEIPEYEVGEMVLASKGKLSKDYRESLAVKGEFRGIVDGKYIIKRDGELVVYNYIYKLKEKKVKSFFDLMKVLELQGFEFLPPRGGGICFARNEISSDIPGAVSSDMLNYCGKKPPVNYDWHPDWLE